MERIRDGQIDPQQVERLAREERELTRERKIRMHQHIALILGGFAFILGSATVGWILYDVFFVP